VVKNTAKRNVRYKLGELWWMGREEVWMQKILWGVGVFLAVMTAILALVATESAVDPIAVIALGGASFLFFHASKTIPT
jgi:hypothetical protein